MTTAAQAFYGPFPTAYSRQDVLDGHVVHINPALITLTEGMVARDSIQVLQDRVRQAVLNLAADGVRTFHADINLEDYGGFASKLPDMNSEIFSPLFLAELCEALRPHQAFVNVHLLTGSIAERLLAFRDVPIGAVCFQLDAVEADQLDRCLDLILEMGACASPVIETSGSDHLIPPSPDAVYRILSPRLDRIGMLTFQAAGTASRSNAAAGSFDSPRLGAYLEPFRHRFDGALQVQGGITTQTIAAAVTEGFRFLVCGTQLFHHKEGHTPQEVLGELLLRAADVLRPQRSEEPSG